MTNIFILFVYDNICGDRYYRHLLPLLWCNIVAEADSDGAYDIAPCSDIRGR